METELKRLYYPKVRKNVYKIVSSGSARAIALISTQKLRLPKQDQTNKNLSICRKGVQGIPSPRKAIGKVYVGGGRIQVSAGYALQAPN